MMGDHRQLTLQIDCIPLGRHDYGAYTRMFANVKKNTEGRNLKKITGMTGNLSLELQNL